MLAIRAVRGCAVRAYRITATKCGGLRLAVFEGGLEVAGGAAPTQSEDDRQWLQDRAAELGAFEELDQVEGGADAKSTP